MNKQEIYEIILKLKEQKLTSPQIAIELNNKQIKTVKGLEWTANLVNDFCYKQKKNVKKLTNNITEILTDNTQDTELATAQDITESITELDEVNADKELAQDSQQIVIQNDIQTVIQNDIQTVIQNDIQTVIQNDIQTVIQNDIQKYKNVIQKYKQLIKRLLEQNKTDIQNDIQTDKTDIQTDIQTDKTDIQTDIQTDNAVIQTDIQTDIQTKFYNWNIVKQDKFFRAYKRINGKMKCIYIGKIVNKDIIKEKLLSKGFDVN